MKTQLVRTSHSVVNDSSAAISCQQLIALPALGHRKLIFWFTIPPDQQKMPNEKKYCGFSNI
jgi:hypothetical protein